jgi:hypothetical protein
MPFAGAFLISRLGGSRRRFGRTIALWGLNRSLLFAAHSVFVPLDEFTHRPYIVLPRQRRRNRPDKPKNRCSSPAAKRLRSSRLGGGAIRRMPAGFRRFLESPFRANRTRISTACCIGKRCATYPANLCPFRCGGAASHSRPRRTILPNESGNSKRFCDNRLPASGTPAKPGSSGTLR